MREITERLRNCFSELKFVEKTHTYTVQGKRMPSVSGLIKNYYKDFDSKAQSVRTARVYGRKPEDVRAEWKAISDEACERGTRVHLFAEDYVWDRSLKPSCQQEEAACSFWDTLPSWLVPVTMEIQMFHKEFDFAGTADIVLYNKRTDKLIIADYKTNKDLFKNHRGQTMLKPFSHLLDMPLNKYQLQLSYYQILLEQTGFEVESRVVVWLKKDGTFDMYHTEDYTEILNKELEAWHHTEK